MSLSNRYRLEGNTTLNELRGAARSIIDYCRLELRLPSVRLTQYHKVTSVVIVKSPQTGRIPAHVLDTASLVPWPKIHWRLVLTIRRITRVVGYLWSGNQTPHIGVVLHIHERAVNSVVIVNSAQKESDTSAYFYEWKSSDHSYATSLQRKNHAFTRSCKKTQKESFSQGRLKMPKAWKLVFIETVTIKYVYSWLIHVT